MATIFRIGFSGIGGTVGDPPNYGLLSLAAESGPTRIRVDWGAPDPFGGDPQVTFYHPQPDGSFSLPGPEDGRSYTDGSYLIRARAELPDGPPVTEVLAVFFDINSATGVSRTGRGFDDLMSGGSGNDSFSGSTGDDWLFGGLGADLLNGGAGDDFLGGGGDASADTLNGSSGNDLIAGDDGDDSIDGGADTDYLYGGNGADLIRGGSGGDYADGEAGNDSLYGGSGNDLLRGGEGSDRIVGEAGDDEMQGGAAEDRLIGGGGADIFDGGAGVDTLVSEADGAEDRFVLTGEAGSADRITGFEAGTDKLHLRNIEEALVGPGRFAGSAAEITDDGIWVVYEAATGRLAVDLDGTGAGQATEYARLLGAPALGYADLMFAPADLLLA